MPLNVHRDHKTYQGRESNALPHTPPPSPHRVLLWPVWRPWPLWCVHTPLRCPVLIGGLCWPAGALQHSTGTYFPTLPFTAQPTRHSMHAALGGGGGVRGGGVRPTATLPLGTLQQQSRSHLSPGQRQVYHRQLVVVPLTVCISRECWFTRINILLCLPFRTLINSVRSVSSVHSDSLIEHGQFAGCLRPGCWLIAGGLFAPSPGCWFSDCWTCLKDKVPTVCCVSRMLTNIPLLSSGCWHDDNTLTPSPGCWFTDLVTTTTTKLCLQDAGLLT